MSLLLLPALLVTVLAGGHSPAPRSTSTYEAIEITANDMTFRAIAAGPRNGVLVILLHGFPETGYTWRRQLDALAREGYRAVAPDQRGYSPDARPDSLSAYAMKELVGDVLAIATALGHPRFHLVGHDWGGAVAWATASVAPQRLLSLNVLSTPHYEALAAGRGTPGSEQARRSAYLADFAAPGAESLFIANDAARLRAVYASHPPDARDTYLGALGNITTLRAALAWYRAAFGQSAPAQTKTAASARIAVPTLYLYGEDDGAFAPEAAELTREHVGGPYRFVRLPGVGHWLTEAAPDVVTRELLSHLGSTKRPVSEAAAQPSRRADGIPPDTIVTVVHGDTVPGFGAVGGVAVDRLGYVYTANFRNEVWRYSPGGAIERYATGLYGASGNAIGPRGELYQSSFHGNTISRIDRSGRITTVADTGLNGPVGLTVGEHGQVYAVNCTGNTVSVVDSIGRVRSFAEGPLFACPNGITRDDRGDLYVVNFGNSQVIRVTPDGNTRVFTDIPGAGGNGHIAFGRDGFFVTKFRGHQVFRVERDGSVRVLAGTGEQGQRDGAATSALLSQPNGIAIGPGAREVWVNELINGNGVGGGPATAVLRRIRLVTLADVLTAAVAANTPTMAAYERYRAERPAENTTADAITFAYLRFTPAHAAEALGLFARNARDFPQDANSQFHLGEAYRFSGQLDRAATQYRRTLELDSTHAQAALRLNGGKP